MRLQGWTLGLLVALGALRIGYAQVLRPALEAHADGAQRIDPRYAGLAPLLAQLPPGAPLAYRTEGAPDALSRSRRFSQASYALAPRVLVPDAGDPGWVLLDLEETESAARALAGLRPIGRSQGGQVLLARREARAPEP